MLSKHMFLKSYLCFRLLSTFALTRITVYATNASNEKLKIKFQTYKTLDHILATQETNLSQKGKEIGHYVLCCLM